MKEKLALPPALLDHSSIVRMLTLIFPSSTTMALPTLTYRVDRKAFNYTFKENNKKLRLSFFSEPLISHLWT